MKITNLESFNLKNAIKYALRLPMESTHLSDSTFEGKVEIIGPKDMELALNLVKAGSDHRKFLRQILVSAVVEAPWYWWKEYETYQVGTTEVSSSQMHKLGTRELTTEDIKIDIWDRASLNMLDLINQKIREYQQTQNILLKKQKWRAMIQIISGSFIYTRSITLNYEVLLNQYRSRKNHKLVEWHQYLEYMKTYLPYPQLFMTTNEQQGMFCPHCGKGELFDLVLERHESWYYCKHCRSTFTDFKSVPMDVFLEELDEQGFEDDANMIRKNEEIELNREKKNI